MLIFLLLVITFGCSTNLLGNWDPFTVFPTGYVAGNNKAEMKWNYVHSVAYSEWIYLSNYNLGSIVNNLRHISL